MVETKKTIHSSRRLDGYSVTTNIGLSFDIVRGDGFWNLVTEADDGVYGVKDEVLDSYNTKRHAMEDLEVLAHNAAVDVCRMIALGLGRL